MKVPKLPRSVISHYAALAKSEQVAIEIKVGSASFRITPLDAHEQGHADSIQNTVSEQAMSDGLKPW